MKFPTSASPRSVLLYGVLLLIVGGTGWLAQWLTPPAEPIEPKPKGTVDYYAVNLLRTIADEAGKTKNILYAEKLTHYDNDDHSELEKPVLTMFSGDGPPWVVHGEQGTVSSRGSEVFLKGPVLVLRDADRNGRTVRAEASNVKILPDEEYGETDDFVQIVSPPDELSGVGMQAHFGKALKVTVLSSVRRRHDVVRAPDTRPRRKVRPQQAGKRK
ncbi:LPS export ABC transporter periplasmic protein LptC [Methylolobus aquaticus]|nr:LPS export ABC transporter periplasmic protein LptC [Methylolobus aquaticus]